MKPIYFLIAAELAAFLSWCGIDRYLANTEIQYKDFHYSSRKNQEGLKASGQFDSQGNILSFNVETTASTPESAIAAVAASTAQLQAQISELLKTLIPIIQQVASRGAVGGAAAPLTGLLPPAAPGSPVPQPDGGSVTPNVQPK